MNSDVRPLTIAPVYQTRITLYETIEVESKTATKKLLEQAEKIRNNLAHAQDIITGFWPEIVEIAEKIETLLDQCERAKISSSSEAA